MMSPPSGAAHQRSITMLSQVNSTSFLVALAIAIPWFVAVRWLAQRLNRGKTDKITAPAALF